MKVSPYVSFVSWGRNDGYAPGFVERVSRAASCLAGQLERAALPAEIIFVEWNPAPGRPLMVDIVDVPRELRHVAIRGVIVPARYHHRLAGFHKREVHSGEAANVGIRRARGRFVTPKASDTVFSPAVIARMARQDLDVDVMYRVDRHDVTIDDDALWQLDEARLFDRLAALPSTRHVYLEQPLLWQIRDLHTNACGDFTLMAASHWHRLRGHARDRTALSLDIDSLVMHAAAAVGVKECRWPDPCRIYKPVHGNLNNARTTQVWRPWQRRLEDYLLRKYSDAVAHRARMIFNYPRRRVRGVDNVLGSSIERNFAQPASRWARGDTPAPTQPANWGLGDERLDERTLCRAAWEPVAGTGAAQD
jgi:hypothetical protein